MSRIIIQRSKGFGDVIAATAIATHLFRAGHKVAFQTEPLCRQVLENHPHIESVSPSNSEKPHMDFDSEEVHENQKLNHLQECYAKIAKKWIPMAYPVIRPEMSVTEEESRWVFSVLKNYPRPWIFICPGSWQAMGRTVSQATWTAVMFKISGSFFNPTNSPLSGAIGIGNGTFRGLMQAMRHADCLLTVDSGPMHVAASLFVPVVAIEQAWPIHLRIPTGAQCETVSCNLPCSPCREHICPRADIPNKAFPPCQTVNADAIVAAYRRL